MSFFKNLFNFGKKGDPVPRRPLRLQFVPAPGNAHVFARQFVDVVWNNDRFQLDYSAGSVRFVDAFLQRFSDAGITANDFAETIFVAGAYLGQIMVQQSGGQWISNNEVNHSIRQSMMPIVVRLPNGTITDPISKVFRRYHFGKAEDLSHYYQELTGRH